MPTEFLRGEAFLVQWSARHEATFAAPGLNPEEQAIANEEARFGPVEEPDDPPPRDLPPEVVQAIEALPLEDAYMLRRMLDGASQREIAAAVGIRQPSVCHRLGRAMEQVRRSVNGAPPLKRIRARMVLPGVVTVRSVSAEGPVLRVTARAPAPVEDTLTLPGVETTNGMGLIGGLGGGRNALTGGDVLTRLKAAQEQADHAVREARKDAEAELARLTARCEELREALGMDRGEPEPARPATEDPLRAIQRTGDDGATFADLLRATGWTEKDLRRELGALRGKGLVTTTGSKRSQRYVAA